MCSYQEWERLTSPLQEAVDDDRLRELLANAAARVEALVDELKRRACAPEDADWVGGRHSGTEWVA